MTLEQTIKNANAADDAWQAYLDTIGVSRWNVDTLPDYRNPKSKLMQLFAAKKAADQAMADAFTASRAKPAYVETDTETAYGQTCRSQRSFRVF